MPGSFATVRINDEQVTSAGQGKIAPRGGRCRNLVAGLAGLGSLPADLMALETAGRYSERATQDITRQ
jgi:hypothetical protein